MEMQAEHENHLQPTSNQLQHEKLRGAGSLAACIGEPRRPGTMASSNVNAYHQTALQHAQAQPVSAADREAGSHYNPQQSRGKTRISASPTVCGPGK